MTKLIESRTRLEAWALATSLLFDSDDRSRRDLILSISEPEVEHELTESAFEALDENYEKAEEYPIHTVAEWIFPAYLYRTEGIEGVYETYPERMQTFGSVTNWGTYALRMVNRVNPETGDEFNPLERLIEKMGKARNDSGFQTFTSCYELGFLSGPFDIPLYDPAADRKRYRGGPCLSHVSFKLMDDEVHLSAFYRSHDYRFKVPGNLLGLARLQECVSQEIGASIGELVIHSSRAYIQSSGGIPGFRDIVKNVESNLG
jgi:hypothetical protein